MDPKRSHARRSPSQSGSIESRRTQDDPPVSNGRNPQNFVQRPSVGSLIAPPLPVHNRRSEHSEAHTEKEKGPKQSYVRPEEEKERLECNEDDDDENFPFTNDLKVMEIPVNFRMPLMDKYKRRGDPSDYINIYKTKLQGQSPAVKCQNFHTTLVSDAKRWYNKLKPGRIRSWHQLKREFFNAFIGNRTMIADIAQLNDIQQNEWKTVKSYFKRFSNVINKIETVTDEKVLDALVTGFYMCTLFWKDVQNSQPKTYSQLVDLVQHDIQSEKMIENRKKAKRERGDRYRRKGRRSPEPRFNRFQKRHSPGPQNNHYKRFN
ncbi:Ribonuclease H [Abeliophyllum distichum]|uniref:Ribonuclease H n=1 Tax=Abeliophyllum distichum TaxID=126358 RepID=A0ABD1SVD8_9LAMI